MKINISDFDYFYDDIFEENNDEDEKEDLIYKSKSKLR